MDPPRVGIVVTVRNEAAHLRHLLDSLVPQRHVVDVVVVDAMSTDGTADIALGYAGRLPVKVLRQACTRGEGRNLGARATSADLLCFIDGDCIANPFWTERLAQAWAGDEERVVAGRTDLVGFWAFTKLHRVELAHKGQDTTWPSCNLAYGRRLFERLGGFDAQFVTAEDIDLNVRAVGAGANIVHAPEAIVYARARDSITGFLRQAYWNGYGRKQLTRKHGRLWSEYSFGKLVRRNGASFWGILRMGAGLVGYLDAKRGRKPPRRVGASDAPAGTTAPPARNV